MLPVIGGYFYQTRTTDEKIDIVEENIGVLKERTAKLEEAVDTIKKDSADTRADIKNFLRELRK